MFFHEFWEIFKSTFFHRTPLVAVSEKLKAEAVVQRYSVNFVFLEILPNSQENTCARVSLLQPEACKSIKIESMAQVLSCEFREHLSNNTFFYRTPLVAASIKALFSKDQCCK